MPKAGRVIRWEGHTIPSISTALGDYKGSFKKWNTWKMHVFASPSPGWWACGWRLKSLSDGPCQDSPYPFPSAPGPAWMGEQQVSVRGQRRCLGGEFRECGWLEARYSLPQMGSHGGCLLPAAHTSACLLGMSPV